MKKIYIVDDEQRIRELIQMYLKKEGYDTKIFSNAKDALKKLFFPRFLPIFSGCRGFPPATN